MRPSTPATETDAHGFIARRWASLRVYTFAILAVTLTTPVAVFGHFQGKRWDTAARENHDRRLALASYRLAADIGAFMHAQTFSIQAAARVVGAMDTWSPELVQGVVDGLYNPQFFSGIFLSNTSGRSIVFAPAKHPGDRAGVDYSDRSYFQTIRAEQRLVMTEAIMGRETKTPIMTIAAPVFSPSGDWRGLVAGGVRQSNLEDLVDSFRERTDDERIVILDGELNVLFDSSETLPVLANVANVPPYTQARLPGDQTFIDDLGVEVRAFKHPVELPGESWSVWVMTPTEIIDTEANSARAQNQRFALVLISIAFVMALLISALAGRVIRRVRALTTSLGDPEFTGDMPNINPWTPTEVADLTRTTYASIERLQRYGQANRALVHDLEAKEARILPLATAWDHIDDAIEFTDPDGRAHFRNPTAMDLGRELHGELPARCELFEHADIDTDSIWAALHAGQTWRGEYRVTDTQGDVRHLSASVSPVRDADDTLRQIVVIRRDVTLQHTHTQVARHNERLAALGTMAATVAHEINNPLTYIRANLEDLKEQFDDNSLAPGEDAVDAIDDALEGTTRVGKIVRRMLSLARDESQEEGGDCVVAMAIENAVAVTKNELKHRATIELDVAPDLRVPLPPSSLFQILVNLLHNAAQAIDPTVHREAVVNISARLQTRAGRETVKIAVSDTGRGMSPDIAARIFDPFFTTKQIGEGTGLGLSVCRSLVEAAGGTLHVTSAPGEGTTFSFELPRVSAANASGPMPAATTEPDAPAHRSGTWSAPYADGAWTPHALVIDDEPAVGRVLKRMLRGVDVTVVTESDAALDTLRTGNYDVVISDVMMPEISGPQLRQMVVAERPALSERWVFVSGGIFDDRVQALLDASGAPLLPKPIQGAVLRRMVAEVLERGPFEHG